MASEMPGALVDVESLEKAMNEAAEGVQKLVDKLKSSVGADRIQAASSVGKLLDSRSSQLLFFGAGGVQTLVGMLQNGQEIEREKATEILVKLSETKEIHAAIIAEGCVPELVKVLRDGRAGEKARAAEALVKLSENEQNHATLLSEGAVSALFAHARDLSGARQEATAPSGQEFALSSGNGVASTSFNESDFNEFKSKTSEFLSRLDTHMDDPVNVMVSSGGESLLGLLLRVGNAREKERALYVLKPIAERSVSSTINRLIPDLIKLLKGTDIHVQVAAASVLGLLANQDELKSVEMGKLGVVLPLVALLQTTEEHSRRDVFYALLNVSYCKENSAAFVDAGATPLLLAALRGGENNEKSLALGVIGNLTETSQGLIAFAQLGGIPIYLDLISDEQRQHKFAVEQCFSSILNSAAALRVLNAGSVISILVALVRYSNRRHPLFDSALKQLAKLSEDPHSLNVTVNTRVIQFLAELASDSNFVVKQTAARILECLPVRSDEIAAQPLKRARTDSSN